MSKLIRKIDNIEELSTALRISDGYMLTVSLLNDNMLTNYLLTKNFPNLDMLPSYKSTKELIIKQLEELSFESEKQAESETKAEDVIVTEEVKDDSDS